MKLRILLLLALLVVFCGADLPSRFVGKRSLIQVDLVSDSSSVREGDTVRVGVHFRIESGWHIYGEKPGALGRPTSIRFELPAGVQVSALHWPEPKKFQADELVSFGYDRETLISAELIVPSTMAVQQELPIRAMVEWTLCGPECIPGKTDLTISLPKRALGAATTYVPAREMFDRFSAATESSPHDAWLGNLLLLLASAFLGGFLLNAMPCVFPVISLKALGFLKHAESRQSSHHALFFSLGVLVSFWILGAGLWILRGLGAQVGWGFQFQSPLFVALMALTLFATALNLFGVFEFGLGIQTFAGKADRRDGYFGAFCSGALATLLATPCSAPFMATAIAAALRMPPSIGLVVLSFVGLGMSSPYLALAIFPNQLERLPAPGEWMNQVKQVLAFPLLASVIWLAWVYGKQQGIDGVVRLLVAMLVLAFGIWVYGQLAVICRTTGRRRIAASFGFIASASAFLIPVRLDVFSDSDLTHRGECGSEGNINRVSERFTAARLQQLKDAGRPVLVEFSAAWCLTCQLNHRVIFGSEQVRRILEKKNVAVLDGDWTNHDPEVSKAISELGREGVPLSVLWHPARIHPLVFSSVLTEGELTEALADLPDRIS